MRLQHCVKLHKRLFGVDVKKIGGDQGYAGTENRDWCKEKGIHTANVVQLAERVAERQQAEAA